MINRTMSKTFSSIFIPADMLAGLSVAGILLPEAIAYAAIAHLSIQAAITALLVGLICYAALGASRFAIVSPTSSSAALVAAASLSMLAPGSAGQAALSYALVILTGAGLVLVAFARLGRLSAFISRPVLRGFSFALAATIIIKQLPVILGVTASGPNPLIILIHLFDALPHWSWWSLAAGVAALLLMLVLKHATRLPAAFIVLAAGVALSYGCDLSAWQIAVVGHVELNLPDPSLPDLGMKQWLSAAELAGGLLVIIFSESWGSIRSLAVKHGDRIDPNRELLSLGTANLVAGLMQGLPVGAGFSASVANEASGAQSKMAGVFSVLGVLLLVVFGRPLIEHIPEPVLAAAVVGALLHALNLQPILALWRLNRDQYLNLAAIIAVFFFGVLHGMLIAVALSIAAAIRGFSQPAVQQLAELGTSRNYVDKKTHPEVEPNPDILILRPEEPLFFASVDGITDVIRQRVQQSTTCRILILSLEESNDLDSSAHDSLTELCLHLQSSGIITLLARVKDPVRTLLLSAQQDLFDNRLFWSVADAATCAEQLLNQP